ncbi:MAG: hypothetical protein HFG80_01640 [Eubacterium sp.]|nr:hypothetical protein [Eubacterium sp.]
MKNLKSFPFERNRYFYGKLLSVEDFETEQKYFNDKRRTINRFLFGSGVVCGLHVLEVDDESISLERGLALDFAGREIVVDEPVVKRIADIEGYDTEQTPESDRGFYYLCLDYKEQPCERMHNVADTGQCGEGEYNKYKEGYRLYITQNEPEREVCSAGKLYEKRIEVYYENGIRISQTLPKYLETGSDTALRVEVENTGQQQSFSFSYELSLSFLTFRDDTKVRVCFDEKDHAKDQKYVLEIPLKAAGADQVEAEAALVPESFQLTVGKKKYRMAEGRSHRVQVGRQDASRKLLEEYYKSAMDHVMDYTFRQSIYLAKIYVVKTEDLCLIERIERLPFGQYILHTEIAAALLQKLAEDVKKLKAEKEIGKKQEESGKKQGNQTEAAYGEVIFDVKKAKAGEVLYSEQIYHGLGLCPVMIELGYEAEYADSQSTETVFGDASVFQNAKPGFLASLGAKLELSEGAFVIGMRVQRNDTAQKVRVRWSAVKNPEAGEAVQKKRLFIQPDIPNLHVGETMTFTTVTEGFEEERIKWTVKDQDGGTIDKNGKYTAPETAGVYRISAASTAYPDIAASTFVVVREKEKDWLG